MVSPPVAADDVGGGGDGDGKGSPPEELDDGGWPPLLSYLAGPDGGDWLPLLLALAGSDGGGWTLLPPKIRKLEGGRLGSLLGVLGGDKLTDGGGLSETRFRLLDPPLGGGGAPDEVEVDPGAGGGCPAPAKQAGS